ncbi:MAG: Xaa-Pro peptidase family protein [Eubacteriales bacterium]|nr:Xaa-Pro peptidase family protein [Eubacteriales bacterium]
MSAPIMRIPRKEYDARIARVQEAMRQEGLDLLITHACGCESATIRYLTDFWAVFDFAGVLVPARGKPILLTGGPESYDFAKQFAQIDDVRVHPLYVETSAPEWDKPASAFTFPQILDELRSFGPLKRIGIANVNTLPQVIYHEMMEGAGDAEIVPAEGLIMGLRAHKSQEEIKLLREACRITEEAMKEAVSIIRPGVREWEIQAAWMAKALKMGAEGTGYPCWVTSGPNTFQSLCKSTDRQVQPGDMVQLSLGAKYSGYCGNMCRAVILGNIPQKHMDMINVAHECLEETVTLLKPGIPFATVYDRYQARLDKYGFKGLTLYGPAHSTGLQECEEPWVDNRSGRIVTPDMVFNIDIWIADEQVGVRLEDCVLVTENGNEQLTSWQRQPLILEV